MTKPIIYQILPRLWGNPCENPVKDGELEQNGTGKFSNIDTETFDYLKSLGVSHIWYTGIIRHATACATNGCEASSTDWVKGKAGSPYSITDYFDVNPYLANDPNSRMAEFEDLVKRTHDAGLKVIIDFVPNHVARDYGKYSPKPIIDGKDANGHKVFGATDDMSVQWKPENDFFYYPGTALKIPEAALQKIGAKVQTYEENPSKASGNNYSPNPSVTDWYDTIKLNYSDFHTETWDKMLDILEFWISKGVDGFRCDMVELVPSSFFRWLIERVKSKHQNIVFVAEVYQKNLYSKYIHEVGFDYLYDKSGLYDSLRAIVLKNTHDSGVPVEQWQSTKLITWNWQQLGDLQPRMLNFLENHDEQRFASDFFGMDGSKVFAALSVSLLFNTSAFMLYFGQEIGERGMDEEGMSGLDGRTTIFDWWNPDAIHRLYKYIHGDNKALNDNELAILNKYQKLMKFASESEAITKGNTYDLCYCNLSSNGFNQDRHFAFLRDYKKETYLVVSNFSANDADIDIYIPEHAFNWLEMAETSEYNHQKPINVNVKAMDNVIVRIR